MTEMFNTKDIGAQRISPHIKSQEYEIGTNITALCLTQKGCVVGLGDGRVMRIEGKNIDELAIHDGAVTSVIKTSDSVISSGQDGMVFYAKDGAGGEKGEYRAADGNWVEVATYHEAKELYAFAVGKTVTVKSKDSILGYFSDHSSTITGLAFSPNGDEIAVSHYDFVTIWSIEGNVKPRRLAWKGSLIQVSWSPNGRYIVASTQDREIHIWDLISGKDYRFGGFKGKVKNIGWTDCSNYMITSGTDVIAAWPITADPGTFPPKEIGYVYSANVSCIACGKQFDRVAGGFSDGSILIGNIKNSEALVARNGTGAEITEMVWNHDQSELLFGTKDGVIGTIKFQS